MLELYSILLTVTVVAFGIKGEGTSLRAWRRLCVDLYQRWHVDPDVHRLITEHGAVAVASDLQRDDRQDTLRSTYFDQGALHFEQEAQAVMQHMRVSDRLKFPTQCGVTPMGWTADG